jgi:hypothetical protein
VCHNLGIDPNDPSNQTLKIAEANFRQARTAIRFNRAAKAPTSSSCVS